MFYPTPLALNTWMDELGLTLGLSRLPSETKASFYKRLLHQSVVKPTVNASTFRNTVSNQIGEAQKLAFKVSLDLDDNGNLAAVNYFTITDSEVQLGDNAFTKVKFTKTLSLDELLTSLNEVTGITASVLSNFDGKLLARNLVPCTTLKAASSVSMGAEKYTKLPHQRIYNFLGGPTMLFPKSSIEDCAKPGDYCVNFSGGTVYRYDPKPDICSYCYQDNKISVYWQPIKVVELSEESLQGLYYENGYLEDGTIGPKELGSYGCDSLRPIYEVNSIGWGK